jgi:hypothetical protein
LIKEYKLRLYRFRTASTTDLGPKVGQEKDKPILEKDKTNNEKDKSNRTKVLLKSPPKVASLEPVSPDPKKLDMPNSPAAVTPSLSSKIR